MSPRDLPSQNPFPQSRFRRKREVGRLFRVTSKKRSLFAVDDDLLVIDDIDALYGVTVLVAADVVDAAVAVNR